MSMRARATNCARVGQGEAGGGSSRVFILEAFPKGLAEVLCDLLDADAAHRAHGERADQRVGVL